MFKKELISKKLKENKKKTVYGLEDLYLFVSNMTKICSSDIKNKYYLDFYNIIQELEKDGVIKHRGKKKTRLNPSLFLEYKVVREVEELSAEDINLITRLNKINTIYYNKRPKELNKDYDVLLKINEALRNKESYKNISFNELSYLLFGYEKEMSSGNAATVLGKVNLKPEDFGCRLKNSPLLNTIYKGFYAKSTRKILIVENLETYWSLNELLRIKENDIDMLVWGQGYDIVKNFHGITLYGVTTDDIIYYFGDIDLSGIDIYLLFKERFNLFNIKPETLLYENLFKVGVKKGIKKSVSPDQRDVSEDKLNIFLDYFNENLKEDLKSILLNREYIPQEALNYNMLERYYIW